MEAEHATAPGRHEQHVALAEQFLGADLVEDGARIVPGRRCIRDPAREVCLDRARQDVDRGALGRHDQVDADGPRHLREASDRGLDLRRGDHHQVGQFVDHDHVVRERFEVARLGRLVRLLVPQAKAPGHLRIGDCPVVEVDRSDVNLRQQTVTALHLGHGPAQRVRGLLGLHHNGGLQVRDVRVHAEFDPLRVDQDELDFVAPGAVQDGGQHALEAHALAGAGGPRYQQMRHLGQVGEVRLATKSAPERHGERRLAVPEPGVGQEAAQGDDRPVPVRDLDAQRRSARHAFDPDRLGLQRKRQIVLEVDDLGDLHTGRRLELEDGDDRTGADALDRALDSEFGAAGADEFTEFPQPVSVDLAVDLFGVEQIERRQFRVLDRRFDLLRARYRRLRGYGGRRRRPGRCRPCGPCLLRFGRRRPCLPHRRPAKRQIHERRVIRRLRRGLRLAAARCLFRRPGPDLLPHPGLEQDKERLEPAKTSGERFVQAAPQHQREPEHET